MNDQFTMETYKGTGRGAAGKQPFVAAVAVTAERQPLRVKLNIVPGFRSAAIEAWGKKHIEEGAWVTSDGRACFRALTQVGCKHNPIVCGGGRASVEEPAFYWVNTILGNLKSALRSTYHAVRPKYFQRYLAEFQYRFNRRYDLPALVDSLCRAAVNSPPMPDKMLKLGLA